MSDFDEMDYDITADDSRSEEDADERLEELYNDAKAEPNYDPQLNRFDELFSLELSMLKKTVWGFKAAKRLLKNAIEQSNFEAATAHYRHLLSCASAVTSNDFDRCASKIVNFLAINSQTEILRALLSASIADVSLTNASARTAIKLAQLLVRLQPNKSTLGFLTDLQHRLEGTNDVAKMTTNRSLLELYALEMELFWGLERFDDMEVVYLKALSMDDDLLGSQHMASAHGYHGRYLLRCNKSADALDYLAKAVRGYESTSVAVEHHTACVQSLAFIAYTSATTNADELLDGYGGRPDVAAIRRFAAAFLNADVAACERALDEIEGSFNDREVLRFLRLYATVLKRKLCLK